MSRVGSPERRDSSFPFTWKTQIVKLKNWKKMDDIDLVYITRLRAQRQGFGKWEQLRIK